MAGIAEYLGTNAAVTWAGFPSGDPSIKIDAMAMGELGLLDAAGSDEAALIGFLNILYERTKDKGDDPTYKIVGAGLFQGRQSFGTTDPVLMDTFDFTFQVRVPSSSGTMPDPDDL